MSNDVVVCVCVSTGPVVSQLGPDVYAWPEAYSDAPVETLPSTTFVMSDAFDARAVVFGFLAHFHTEVRVHDAFCLFIRTRIVVMLAHLSYSYTCRVLVLDYVRRL